MAKERLTQSSTLAARARDSAEEKHCGQLKGSVEANVTGSVLTRAWKGPPTALDTMGRPICRGSRQVSMAETSDACAIHT